jgi:hypothetical protein
MRGFGQQNAEDKLLDRIYASSCSIKSLKILGEFRSAKRMRRMGLGQTGHENHGDSGGQPDSIVEQTLHV